MIKLTIDGHPVEHQEKVTILHAARELKIHIPTLCHNEYITPYGGCRLCLVEVATDKRPDAFKLMAACCSHIKDGLIVLTDTEKIRELRKFIIELLLARSPHSEKLQEIAGQLGISRSGPQHDPVARYLFTRAKPLSITKCILCGLCVRVCAEITQRHAISFIKKGMKRIVTTPFGKVSETCIGCGACAYVCPTNAITIEEA
ncbi:MAG: 4Fe-4S dicluster domain-containing protein [bacterium]